VDAEAYIRERTASVDRWLDGCIPPPGEAPDALSSAMRHLLFPGGKRLRPALAFAAAEAVGGVPEDALPAAVAVELIHTYSMIHDDLPCMDDDVLRRGRPTVHVAFGESTAVLAGDALQAAAFEALATAALERPRETALAVRDLASAAGARELVGGQVDDLAFDPSDVAEVTPERIESIHARKSAALIAVSVITGARMAGADEAQLAELKRFGLEVGVAFQIADDLLDRDEDDLCSLARALGPEAARERAEQLLATALRRVDDLGERAEPLRELARFAVRRNR